jgi:hypothetical protein
MEFELRVEQFLSDYQIQQARRQLFSGKSSFWQSIENFLNVLNV